VDVSRIGEDVSATGGADVGLGCGVKLGDGLARHLDEIDRHGGASGVSCLDPGEEQDRSR
jgi:hypothetical protein